MVLSKEQLAIIDKINLLLREAQNKEIGFVFDKTQNCLCAFNAQNVGFVEVEDVSDNCNLDKSNLEFCDINCYASYYSDGDFLVAHNK